MTAEPKTKRANRAAKNKIWDEMPIRSLMYERDENGYAVSGPGSMGEYEPERRLMTATVEALKLWCAGRDVYVSGLKYVHYTKHCDYVSPDCYVVFGVNAEQLDSDKNPFNSEYFPAIVFEFAQKETGCEGRNKSFTVYENVLKIPEYISYAPEEPNPSSKLQGYRLNIAGAYEPIPFVNGRIYSESLNMFVEIYEGDLLLTDAKSGEYLRTPFEAEQERRELEARVKRWTQRYNEAEHRAREAEAWGATLMAELVTLRNQNEQGQ